MLKEFLAGCPGRGVGLHSGRDVLDLDAVAAGERAADPASGTIPTCYVVWNVTDGAVKRPAGGCGWEITLGASTAARMGFHGATPTPQRANANQAEATDAATTIVLADEPRAAPVGKGVIKGAA